MYERVCLCVVRKSWVEREWENQRKRERDRNQERRKKKWNGKEQVCNWVSRYLPFSTSFSTGISLLYFFLSPSLNKSLSIAASFPRCSENTCSTLFISRERDANGEMRWRGNRRRQGSGSERNEENLMRKREIERKERERERQEEGGEGISPLVLMREDDEEGENGFGKERKVWKNEREKIISPNWCPVREKVRE